MTDKKARVALAQKAAKHNWSVRELKAAIKEGKIELELIGHSEIPPAPPKAMTKLKASPGVPYTYRLEFVPAELLNIPGDESRSGEYCVDLGFSVRRHGATQGLKKITAGMIVEWAACPAKGGGGYSLKESAAKPVELYTYRARLDRIVDGDTLKCCIDLGFSLYISQKLRLAGIDCPELSTPKGQEVKAFVEEALKGKQLLIQTHKTDKWDRYLVDVFFIPSNVLSDEKNIPRPLKEGGGIPEVWAYLNQILLDNGLAELYKT